MKKIIKIYTGLTGLLLVGSLFTFIFSILNMFSVTHVSWWLLATPFYVVVGIPIVIWLIGFFTILGRDLYGRYWSYKARKIAKNIKIDQDEIQTAIKELDKVI